MLNIYNRGLFLQNKNKNFNVINCVTLQVKVK